MVSADCGAAPASGRGARRLHLVFPPVPQSRERCGIGFFTAADLSVYHSRQLALVVGSRSRRRAVPHPDLHTAPGRLYSPVSWPPLCITLPVLPSPTTVRLTVQGERIGPFGRGILDHGREQPRGPVSRNN